MSEATGHALRIQGLTKRYGNFTAVDDVSLDIERGEFLTLLGPSGSGKTTILMAVAGFVLPNEGSILLDGNDITALPPERRNFGMVFQGYALFPHMSVAENVAFPLRVRGLSRAARDEKVRAALDLVQLSSFAERLPRQLSGGQQQRVLARAIVVKPAVLLLDEPLSNLDANLREEMRFEIRRLHDEFRITTVYVTHDQAEAMATSDRIAVMNAGKIEQVDAPHLLYTKPRTRFVAGFVGRTNLLEARVEGGALLLGGLSLGPAAAAGIAPGASGDVLLSLRPQAMSLHLTEPGRDTHALVMPVELLERTYLGEAWDYVLRPEGAALRLRAAAPPLNAYSVGTRLWLRIDPQQIAVVQ